MEHLEQLDLYEKKLKLLESIKAATRNDREKVKEEMRKLATKFWELDSKLAELEAAIADGNKIVAGRNVDLRVLFLKPVPVFRPSRFIQ